MMFARSGISRMIDGNSVYNFKRRMASLPPISATVFQKQVLASDCGNDEKEESSLFQRSCNACEQHYTNISSIWNHFLATSLPSYQCFMSVYLAGAQKLPSSEFKLTCVGKVTAM